MTSIHTVKDYQMNIAVTLDESPTSAAFGANALSLACFPVDAEFLLGEDGGQTDGDSQ